MRPPRRPASPLLRTGAHLPAVQSSLFFAYGPEMASEAMAQLLGRTVAGQRAVVRGWRLAFTAYSDEWEGGVADLIEDPEGEVEGALFALVPRDLLRLEVVEGWQDLEDGRRVEAVARAVERKDPSVAPSPAFLDAMIQAGTDLGLSDDYLTWLLQLYPDAHGPHSTAWGEEE